MTTNPLGMIAPGQPESTRRPRCLNAISMLRCHWPAVDMPRFSQSAMPAVTQAANCPILTERALRPLRPTFVAPIRQYLHYAITALLAIAVYPIFLLLKLPLESPWDRLFQIVLTVTAQSIFVASVLYSIERPIRDNVGILRRHLAKLLLVGPLIFLVLWIFGWWPALTLAVSALALLEALNRASTNGRTRLFAFVALPALYLACGIVLVFYYNAAIVSVRFYASYDSLFNHLDSLLLFGATASEISRWASRVFPVGFFKGMEFVYFGLFIQIGVAIIFTALRSGIGRSMKFVGTILLAYYLTLIIFCLWPSHGPYYLCRNHFSHLSQTLNSYHIQQAYLSRVQELWRHRATGNVAGYYIAFPSMHITQPLIVLWFVRQWKRPAILLLAYDIVLILSIILLEWHYIIDLVGGIAVACAALVVMREPQWKQTRQIGVEPRHDGK